MMFVFKPSSLKTATNALALTALTLSGFSLPLQASEENKETQNTFSISPKQKAPNSNSDSVKSNSNQKKTIKFAADIGDVRDQFSSLVTFQEGTFFFSRGVAALQHIYVIQCFENKQQQENIKRVFENLKKIAPSLFNDSKLKCTNELRTELINIFSGQNPNQLTNFKNQTAYLLKNMPDSEVRNFSTFAKEHNLLECFQILNQSRVNWLYKIINVNQANIKMFITLQVDIEKKSPQDFFMSLMAIRMNSLLTRMNSIFADQESFPLVFNNCQHKDDHQTLRAKETQTTYDFFDIILKALYPQSSSEQKEFEKAFSKDFHKFWEAARLYQNYLKGKTTGLVADDYYSDLLRYIYIYMNDDISDIYLKDVQNITHDQPNEYIDKINPQKKKKKQEYEKKHAELEALIIKISKFQFGKTPIELKKEKDSLNSAPKKVKMKKKNSAPLDTDVASQKSSEIPTVENENLKKHPPIELQLEKKEDIKAIQPYIPIQNLLTFMDGKKAESNPLFEKTKKVIRSGKEEETVDVNNHSISGSPIKKEKHEESLITFDDINLDDIDFAKIENEKLRSHLQASFKQLLNTQEQHTTKSMLKIFTGAGAFYNNSTGSSHHTLVLNGMRATIWNIHGTGRDRYGFGEVKNYRRTFIKWFLMPYLKKEKKKT